MSAGERRFMKTNTNSTASLEPSTHAADVTQWVPDLANGVLFMKRGLSVLTYQVTSTR